MKVDVHVPSNQWQYFFSLAEHAIKSERDRALAVLYENKLNKLRSTVSAKNTAELDLDLLSFVRGWAEIFKATDHLDPKEREAAAKIGAKVKIGLKKKFAHCHG